MSTFDPFGTADVDTGDREKKGTWTGTKGAPTQWTPTAGPFQSGNNNQATAEQGQLMTQLGQQAAGGGPSIAEHQLQGANDQNIRQQAAMAAGNRGNPGAAYAAAQNAGAGSQALSGQAAQARTQEELNAQNAAAGLAGQMQQQGMQGANMANQFGLANAQMSQQGTEAYNTMMAQQQMAQNQQAADLQRQREKEQSDKQQALMGSIESGIGSGVSMLAASDMALKKNIRPGQHSLHDFLDQLDAHEYEYKSHDKPGTAPGTHVSVMAQELEKTPTGKVAVLDAPHGKMVDYAKVLPAMLAAVADSHKRLKSLEKPHAR